MQTPEPAGNPQKVARLVVAPDGRLVVLSAHRGADGLQSAFVWQDAQAVAPPPQTVEPSHRLLQLEHPAGQVAAHEAQVPALQLGVAPRGQMPHDSVPTQPSGSGPQVTPSAAHVVGVQPQMPGTPPPPQV